MAKNPRDRRSLLPLVALVALVGALLPAAPAAAVGDSTLSGTVLAGDDNHALANVTVNVFSAAAGPESLQVDMVGTDAAGFYTVDLPAGEYLVRFDTNFSATAYVAEWSGDSLFASGASAVTLSTGLTTTLDASLALAGRITGTISAPGPGYYAASAYAFDPAISQWVYMGFPIAPSVGNYAIGGLSPTLSYRVRLSQSCEGASCIWPAPRWYPNAVSVATGSNVAVSSGGTTTNIGAALTTSAGIPSSRLQGPDRYATSAAIAAEYDPAAVTTVYLASGQNFPDALSAAPAAAHLGAPLLLTFPTALPAAISSALSTLSPDEVIIVGSEAAVSADVESAVALLLPSATIRRLGGADRFETSRLISADAFGTTGATEAWIATGFNFPDALSAAPIAGHDGAPVILVNGPAASVDTATTTLLSDLGVTKVNIAGSTAVVSGAMQSSLAALSGIVSVERFGGTDRYQTSMTINQYRWPFVDKVYVAVGTGFADALSGAALAGRDGFPLYISPATCVTPPVQRAIWNLTPAELVLFGSPSALNNNVANLGSC